MRMNNYSLLKNIKKYIMNNYKNIKIFSNLWNDNIKTEIDYTVKLLSNNYNN